ncbi:entericidin [Moraxella sp. Tifton1]|uniref:Lipoprotein n=1 Tax=Moraxella oculi TaxID=2940516 RepID=A0ABW8U3C1_9GAMM|nr:entericidin [Moraxella sp. Tifton1]MCL1622749.1 entericidin [Moraxella sp. Tifton1]
MKKLLIAATAIGILAVLSACSQQTKDKANEAVESTKADIATNTAQVAKEAESAAQNVAETTKNAVQAAAEKTSEVAKEVGAKADAATKPASAESQVAEEQKY